LPAEQALVARDLWEHHILLHSFGGMNMATKSLLMGLLAGALVIGTGCATMGGKGSDTDTKPAPSAPTNGGAGLDLNPANNVTWDCPRQVRA
jgi:hypothetical protein